MGVGRTDSVGRAKVLAINYASHLTVPQDQGSRGKFWYFGTFMLQKHYNKKN